MKKIELLQKLSDKVCNCTKCSDLVANRTQTVMSSGNPDAKILIISEAPGETEDKEGEVLIGRAGQLLTNILNACNLDRKKDLYLCNILKCRPPNNRTPTEQEAKNCEPYLKLQIKIVNPKFIVCLGATAAKNLLKLDYPMGYMRGKWFEYKDDHVNAKVLVTYHPSFALRKGDEAKKEIWEDLQMLVEFIA